MNAPSSPRLTAQTIATLPATVERPRYDRAGIRTGIVHLGLGAFHRAHQAVYAEQALDGGDLRWGTLGASLRSPDVHDRMAPQDGLYTVVERDGEMQRLRIIGGIRAVAVAPRDPAALVAIMAAPDTHIVTLTITEKGYRLDPRGAGLDVTDDDVAADMVDLARPRTAPGFLVAALARRRASGRMPFTAVSCDNLPDNGSRLAAAVLSLARHHDPALADWIERHGAFPATMVDRIVPATDRADIETLSATLGVEDRAMVKTEPFSQWVIEDRFCGERPDYAAAGVQLTRSVAPWEDAKLRLLNGAHSGIAYLGGLAGIDHVHEMVARPPVRRFVESLWDEAASTLSPPPGLDLPAYRAALMARFANAALRHRTRQIAMDGSQKLPQRLVAPIVERRRRGEKVDRLSLAVAAWMRWQEGRDDRGDTVAVDDPLAAVIAARIAGTRDAAGTVAALLSLDAIFPTSLAGDTALRETLTAQLTMLRERGAMGTIEATCQG